MTVEKFRADALVEERDRQITGLMLACDLIVGQLRAAFPAMNFTLNTRIYTPSNVVYSDDSKLAGRGYRFCAKYNLARTDDERIALLNSLPKCEIVYFDVKKWMGNYRTDLVCSDVSNASLDLAPEFYTWFEGNVKSDKVEVIEGDFESLKRVLPHPVGLDDSVILPKNFRFFKLTKGVQGNNSNGTHVLIPCPETQSYALFEVHTTTVPSDVKSLSVSLRASCVWSTHELCWTIASPGYIGNAPFKSVMESWLKEMQFPEYNFVEDEDMVKLFERAHTRLIDDWADFRKEEISKRSITLEHKLRVEINPPRSSYGKWDVKCYFLDTPQDIAVDSHFDLITSRDFNSYISSSSPSIRRGGSDSHLTYINATTLHPRQFERVRGLLEELLNTPNESLVIEDLPTVDGAFMDD